MRPPSLLRVWAVRTDMFKGPLRRESAISAKLISLAGWTLAQGKWTNSIASGSVRAYSPPNSTDVVRLRRRAQHRLHVAVPLHPSMLSGQIRETVQRSIAGGSIQGKPSLSRNRSLVICEEHKLIPRQEVVMRSMKIQHRRAMLHGGSNDRGERR